MSAWPDLVTASLIGTERTMVPATRIPGLPAGETPGPAGPAGDADDQAGASDQAGLARDPAALLLDRAALLTVARRAGRMAEEADPLPAAGPDPRPAVSPVAGERLARILGGEHLDLLAEWLGAAVARGQRAPAQLLPALLDRGRRAAPADPGLRQLVAAAGGSRASWLAGLNPDWKWLAGLSPDPASRTVTAAEPGEGARRPGEDLWRLGDIGQRRGYLVALRARDHGAARDLITGAWAAASAGERVMFLRVLAEEPGLVAADEPLLEAALDDRADDVHSWAGYLLATLPGSALGRRMAERALHTVKVRSGTQGSFLAVRPPVGHVPDLRRDGIALGPVTGRAPQGEPARLVLEIVARTPLRTWTDAFAMTVSAIISRPAASWGSVLYTGWSRAAIAQRDQEWMTALITAALSGRPMGMPTENEALSQLARRADPALGAPGGVADPEPGVPAAIRNAITVLRFRYTMLKELDDHDHSDG